MHHKSIPPEQNHGILSWTVATEAALATIPGLVPADIGRVAFVTATEKYFVLMNNVGPVWKFFIDQAHNPVTVSGTPNYITLAGQDLVRAQVNLASHVTGKLPAANIYDAAGHSIIGRANAAAGVQAAITLAEDTLVGRAIGGTVAALTAAQARKVIGDYSDDLPTLKPTLLLDPVNSGVVDPRIVTTRATDATFWDEFGVLKTAPANTLRIDHNPLTGERLGYLVEGAATNYVNHSENFAMAWWVKTSASVVSNLYTEESAGSLFRTSTITLPSAGLVCGFFDVERVNADWLLIYLSATSSGSNSVRCWFNIATGQIGNNGTLGSGVVFQASGIIDLGGGIYRCYLSAQFSDTTGFLLPHTAAGNGIATRADIGSGSGIGSAIKFHRAQLETGVTRPTSYIKTAVSAVTRAADVPVISGAAFSDFYNQNEGTFVFEARSDNYGSGGASAVMHVSNGPTGTGHYLGQWVTPSTKRMITSNIGNTIQASLSGPGGLGVFIKTAAAYQKDNYLGVNNGGSVLSDNLADVPVVDRVHIGCTVTGSQHLQGIIKSITYYPKAVTAAQLQALSRL
jgi:hypothetical protein